MPVGPACDGMRPGSGELLGTFQQPVGAIAADETAIYGLGGPEQGIRRGSPHVLGMARASE